MEPRGKKNVEKKLRVDRERRPMKRLRAKSLFEKG